MRGGDILEKFSSVNAVVFDKTGTLTVGRPVVTKVVTSKDSRLNHDLNLFYFMKASINKKSAQFTLVEAFGINF